MQTQTHTRKTTSKALTRAAVRAFIVEARVCEQGLELFDKTPGTIKQVLENYEAASKRVDRFCANRLPTAESNIIRARLTKYESFVKYNNLNWIKRTVAGSNSLVARKIQKLING